MCASFPNTKKFPVSYPEQIIEKQCLLISKQIQKYPKTEIDNHFLLFIHF